MGFKKGMYFYQVESINDMPQFVIPIAEGNINLYSFQSELFTGSGPYYIEKADSSEKSCHYYKSKGSISNSLIEYVNDYPELVGVIKNNCFPSDALPEVVRIYNDWKKSGINKISPELHDKTFRGFAEGEISLKDGNTLEGFLKYLPFRKQILFKDTDGNSKKYNFNEVNGFELNNRKYIRIYAYHSSLFARVIIKGDVSIYQSLIYLPKGETVRIYVHKIGDDFSQMLTKKSMSSCFSNNNQSQPRRDLQQYTIYDIETLVRLYNIESTKSTQK